TQVQRCPHLFLGVATILTFVATLVIFILHFLSDQADNPNALAAQSIAKNDLEDPSQSSPKRYWPGMWLWGRSGKTTIHIESDGRRESGVPGLIHYLNHDDAGIRECAADWLCAIGGPAKEAIPALKALQNDSDPVVATAARAAIKRIE